MLVVEVHILYKVEVNCFFCKPGIPQSPWEKRENNLERIHTGVAKMGSHHEQLSRDLQGSDGKSLLLEPTGVMEFQSSPHLHYTGSPTTQVYPPFPAFFLLLTFCGQLRDPGWPEPMVEVSNPSPHHQAFFYYHHLYFFMGTLTANHWLGAWTDPKYSTTALLSISHKNRLQFWVGSRREAQKAFSWGLGHVWWFWFFSF